MIKLNKLLKTIYKYDEIKNGEHNKKKIVAKIYSNNLNFKKNRIDKETEHTVPEMNCPQFDGVLIKRSGKYGKFYGCINYPVCKFTQD